MCGVLGTYGRLDKKKRKALRKAFARLATRGTHASGLAGSNGNAVLHYKGAVASPQLLTHLPYQKIVTESECLILHSRYTTQGHQNENKNNHPFVATLADNSILSLVHNGVIPNYAKLKKRFKLETDIATDTYIIVHLITLFYKKHKDMAIAITHALRWLEGSFTLIITHTTNTGEPVMYFVKHKNPLVAFDYNGVKILGSTDVILKAGFNWKIEYTLEEDVLYKIANTPAGSEVYKVALIQIYKPITPKLVTSAYNYNHNYLGKMDSYDSYDADSWPINAWTTSMGSYCSGCQSKVIGTVWREAYSKHLCPKCFSELVALDAEFDVLGGPATTCEICKETSTVDVFRPNLGQARCDKCLKAAYEYLPAKEPAYECY